MANQVKNLLLARVTWRHTGQPVPVSAAAASATVWFDSGSLMCPARTM